MPLTDIQAKVLRLIAGNRSPESYLAGATVLHRHDNTPRFSQDLDFFHDVEDSVVSNAEKDAKTLRESGYTCSWTLKTPTFYRAVVEVNGKRLKMEWAQDSAFRFFPVVEDKHCGYRLHDADAAINKLLALAGRQEIRDYVDILHLDTVYLSLGAMAWAACGKDPGFTPMFLLDQVARHVAYTQIDLNRLSLRKPLDLHVLKQYWLSSLEKARILVASLPADEVGCLYLKENETPVTPARDSKTFGGLHRHYGCIRGAWPTLSETDKG